MTTRPQLHLIREVGPHTAKLRRHDGFRVAADLYEAATMTGAPAALLDILWDTVQCEAKTAERVLSEAAS